jgi:DNA-binding protein HU-beta
LLYILYFGNVDNKVFRDSIQTYMTLSGNANWLLIKSTQARNNMTVSTNDLAEGLAEAHDLTKAQAKTVVEAILTGILKAAADGHEVSLPGFGKFKVRESAARDGRNPGTGAIIKIAASKKLTFQPAKAAKDALNA